ncbi:hypothetical protein HY477_03725 [Candidatus Uhrbacteria bacterium]|nr:hypothetical protein [Candidatus Uhrbacteria bacterium]
MMFKPQFPAAPTGDRSGYALLLAVLITSAVLSSATALASIVIAEIRQTRDVASAIIAYAQAEEQVDKAIFMLRHTDLDRADSVSGFNEIMEYLDGADVAVETRPQYFQIPENDFVSLSIPQDAILGESPSIDITRWGLVDENCVSWIEVSSVAWNTDIGGSDPFVTYRQSYSQNDFINTGLEIPFGVAGMPIEMRIRSLYCDIAELGVSGIPGRIRISAIGQEGSVQQAVETLIVRYPPAAGFADFAIFSECSVIKGEPLSPDCPQ